jgi:hypothetical protein
LNFDGVYKVAKKVTYEEFVERSQAVHREKYTYPDQEYNGVLTKVRIICPKHGEFMQTPTGHMSGKGCKECAKERIGRPKKYTIAAFIAKARLVHEDKYTYPEQEYTSYRGKLRIVCSDHGEFLQSAEHHLSGKGCSKCGQKRSDDAKRDSLSVFITKARTVHGDRYTYPEQEYKNNLTKIKILCPDHGEFTQTPGSHLRGATCYTCGRAVAADKIRGELSEFIEKARSVHGDEYEYPDQKYIDSTKKLKIICKHHGVFKKTRLMHLAGAGCPRCARDTKDAIRRGTWEQFVIDAKAIHGEAYIYPDQAYNNAATDVRIVCRIHGEFSQLPHNHMQGKGCHKCSFYGSSKGEKALAEYFSDYGPKCNFRIGLSKTPYRITRTGNPPARSMELDVYFKSRNLAVEYNGLYWHGEERLGRLYHIEKMNICNAMGIDLIQIFEDEWLYKPDIVKSIISTRLGVYERRYFARKTKLIEASAAIASEFYEKNHIQGKAVCNKHYALSVEGEIVAMASFGNRSHMFKNNDDLELIRFCTKLNTQVVGGLSKLLSVFRDVPVKTYCDLRLFNGNGYKAAGFTEVHRSEPAYFYVKGQNRYSRFQFQKHKLEKVLDNFDPILTEAENMKNNGYSRVFDCGALVLVKRPK